MTGMPSRFASEGWRTVPFGERGKPLLQQLVDIILFIPLCLLQAGQVGPIDRIVLRLVKSDTLPPKLEQNYLQLLEQLEAWWEAYEATPPEESESLFSISGTTKKKYHKVEGVAYSPTLLLQRDAVTAFTVAMFNGTNLIVHTILHALSIASERLGQTTSPPGNSKYHLEQAIIHSDSILDISMHHQAKRPNGMDFMRIMFPLKIVRALSPPKQSQKATEFIKQFHKTNVMPNVMERREGVNYPVYS